MLSYIIQKSNWMWVGVFFTLFTFSAFYIFDPSAEWNVLIANSPIPAPEFQIRLDLEPIHEFFLPFTAADKSVYFFYQGPVDALFYLTFVGFSLCLFAILVKAHDGRYKWILWMPLVVLSSELIESSALMTLMWLSPERSEVLLWSSDIATLVKRLGYGLVFLMCIASSILLLANFGRSRKAS